MSSRSVAVDFSACSICGVSRFSSLFISVIRPVSSLCLFRSSSSVASVCSLRSRLAIPSFSIFMSPCASAAVFCRQAMSAVLSFAVAADSRESISDSSFMRRPLLASIISLSLRRALSACSIDIVRDLSRALLSSMASLAAVTCCDASAAYFSRSFRLLRLIDNSPVMTLARFIRGVRSDRSCSADSIFRVDDSRCSLAFSRSFSSASMSWARRSARLCAFARLLRWWSATS